MEKSGGFTEQVRESAIFKRMTRIQLSTGKCIPRKSSPKTIKKETRNSKIK